MKKLFNKNLKEEKIEKVYIVETKAYDDSFDVVENNKALRLSGRFLANDISVYYSEEEAKAVIKREVDRFKRDPDCINLYINDTDDDFVFIHYSYDPSHSYRHELRVIEREIK